MYEDIIKSYHDFEDSIYELVKKVVNSSAEEAKKQKLNPVQTYDLIENNITKAQEDIEEVYKIPFNPTDSFSLSEKIGELMYSYSESAEDYLRNLIDEIPKAYTLEGLLDTIEEIVEASNILIKHGLNPRLMRLDEKKHLK